MFRKILDPTWSAERFSRPLVRPSFRPLVSEQSASDPDHRHAYSPLRSHPAPGRALHGAKTQGPRCPRSRPGIARSLCRSAPSARSKSRRARGSRTTSGLKVAERDPIIVGVVGNLEPEKPEFPEYLDRYRKNPSSAGSGAETCGAATPRRRSSRPPSSRAEAASPTRIS